MPSFRKMTLAKIGETWQLHSDPPAGTQTAPVMWTASKGVVLIAQERAKQIDNHGFNVEHDARHNPAPKSNLVDAARSYLTRALFVAHNLAAGNTLSDTQKKKPPAFWPFAAEAWKPDNEDPLGDLVKAGALVAAEIDRLIYERESAGGSETMAA
jgi:hypothetical protein